MTNRERFLRCLRYQGVDHPPLMVPSPWPATRRRWESEGLPAGVDLYDYFALPALKYVHLAMETVLHPPFAEQVLAEEEEFVIRINRHGVKEKNFRDGSSMPEFLEYPVKGRSSLPWLREKLSPSQAGRIAADWLEQARLARAAGGLLFVNGGMYFAFLNEHMGTEALMLSFFDDPEFILEVNELQCALCEQALRLCQGQLELDFIGYHEDMAYKNGSLISMPMFRRFMSPYYERISRLAAAGGTGLQMLDSDGNIRELIPEWLRHGINVLCPMEVAAGMDVVALRQEFGPELRMIGGFDKRILAAGQPGIDRELLRLQPLIEAGGYIPAIDHGTPPDVPFAHVCHYVETLKRMFGMS